MADTASLSAAQTSSPARPTRSASLVLGAAIAVANLLAYAFTLLLTRALGPADFGAFYAINSTALILAIPTGALQIVVARRFATATDSGLRLALTVGVALFGLGLVVAPLAAWAFHVGSVSTVVMAMSNLVPTAVVAAASGVLLGSGRLPALAAVTLFISLVRVGVSYVALVGSSSVTAVFAGLLAAGTLGAVVALAAALPEVRRSRSTPVRQTLGELWRSNRTLTGLIALASMDVLLARHFLPAEDSGAYSLAAVFSRAVFWGTQFLALAIVPALHPDTARKRLLEAGATVTVLGLAATAVVLLLPSQLIELTAGADYAHAQGLLALFTLMGTMLGLAQVLLYADMAQDQSHLGLLTWGACIVEVVLVVTVFHDNAFRIFLVAFLAATSIAVLGFWRVWRMPRASAVVSPQIS